MNKFLRFVLLGGLFFLSISPEWSLLAIGEKIAQSNIATLIFQVMIITGVLAVCAAIFFDLPFKKKFKE